MPLGIAFWVVFLLLVLFNFMWYRNGSQWSYGWGGNTALVIILLFLLGWNDFGFILQGGTAAHGGSFH